MADDDAYTAIARLLRPAKRVLFITGAGISADSGLPTYRGVGGLYEDEFTDEGLPIEEALSGRMLAARPEVTWKYLLQIERNCRGATPNRAHQAIADLEGDERSVVVLTQNVDGLHLAAGSRDVIEIHGNVHDLGCTQCRYRTRVDSYAGLAELPLCPRCLAPLRPGVVLFGEALPRTAVRALEDACERGFDLVFSVGTSSLFPYIVEPVLWARAAGTPTVEINPAATVISDVVDFPLRAGAADAMVRIWRTLAADAA
jgi:NAD-dependent deacetylase